MSEAGFDLWPGFCRRSEPTFLGVRLPEQAAFTTDIDVAQFQPISVAIGDRIEPDFAEALSRVERFTPLPSIRDRRQSASWRPADSSIEVELLTPMIGRTDDKLVELPALRAHAVPLRFLDYLIHDADPAAVLHGSGVLVNVPRPEKYALHKLLVSQVRSGADRSKARKDLQQSAVLIAELVKADGGEPLREAWSDLISRGAKWQKHAVTGFRRLPKDVQEVAHAPLQIPAGP